MRILFATDRLSLRGGADQHLLQRIGDRAAQGHRCVVAYGRRDDDVALSPQVNSVQVRGLGTATETRARLGRLDNLLDDVAQVDVQNVMNPAALRRLCADGNAVVTVQDHRVFCPGPGKTLPDGRRCDRLMGVAVCARCLPDDDYRRRMLALTLARLDALAAAREVVVLSRYMSDELAAAGLPGAEVIPPRIDVGSEPPVAGAGFVAGGRLVLHKGLQDAVEAWHAAGTGAPLTIAGEGPLAEQLGQPAVGAGDRRPSLPGWLDVAALRQLLHGARALLFPARWQEPFGILGVQALAEGTPVIVADAGGTRDWSDAGCLRVPAGDVNAMAAAIAALDADPDRALELGRAGRAMVRRRFSSASAGGDTVESSPNLEGLHDASSPTDRADRPRRRWAPGGGVGAGVRRRRG
jgi:hypothetical protein